MTKRSSKSHTLQLQELPVITTGGIRIELACPSGCVRGYVWSGSAADDEYARGMAKAAADQHLEEAKP